MQDSIRIQQDFLINSFVALQNIIRGCNEKVTVSYLYIK